MKNLTAALAALVAMFGAAAVAQSTADPATVAGSPSSVAAASANPAPGLHPRYPRYRLQRDDTFELDFELSPEFNQTVTVEPDGYVTLKDIGSIFVAGRTVPEVTETVKTAYAKILHNPIITVTLKDFEKPYFIAAGQVGKPGKYDLRSNLTVVQAIAIAGGFDDKSKHSQVVLFRPVPGGGYEAKLINVKKMLASRNLSEDIQLQPGDMLYVPQNALSKIRPFLPIEGMGAYYNPAFN